MDIEEVRQDFKIFERRINNKSIVYLDSAATSLKPRAVVQTVEDYYQKYTANIFRGVYRLSEEATEAYEGARKKVAKFIGARSEKEVVFVRNATEAINLVMYAWGKKNIVKDDEIVITMMEHHANLVPWQVLAKEIGAKLRYWEIGDDGSLDLNQLDTLINKSTKLVCLSHVSNVLGTINDVKQMSEKVKANSEKVRILVDGAQAVGHMPVDVGDLGCDWYVFSGHKMYGPTGIGVLWGKEELLEEMEPFMYGGEMIREVRQDGATWAEVPHKFEAGTPHIAGAIGLGTAVDYLEGLGMDEVRRHDLRVVGYGLDKLKEIKGVNIIGLVDAEHRGGVISFTVDGVHPHDVAQVLDEDNVYIRAGHHCAMPLHTYLGLPATCRASFGIYNAKEDVDKLIDGLRRAIRRFKK